MQKKILLTSFQTWLPHQKSNSSDDLLEKIQKRGNSQISLFFLRQLPVDITQASQKAIALIENLQPDGVICCGMAESRQQLTIESNATWEGKQIKTKVDLDSLVTRLSATTISHNAGKFVCEGLYYQVLNHLQQLPFHCNCIFVHVPILTTDNLAEITIDFYSIIELIS